MTPYIDTHTHKKKIQGEDVIQILNAYNTPPLAPMFYSVGIHPFMENQMSEKYLNSIKKLSTDKRCLAIGEAGLDYLHDVPREKAKHYFKECISLSEAIGKPLIIHSVKATQDLMVIYKEQQPNQKWIIHGFRGKPTQAETFIKHGFFLSMGEKFNPDTLTMAYQYGRLLLETDDSNLSIYQVYQKVCDILSIDIQHLKESIYCTAKEIYSFYKD